MCSFLEVRLILEYMLANTLQGIGSLSALGKPRPRRGRAVRDSKPLLRDSKPSSEKDKPPQWYWRGIGSLSLP